MARVSLTIHRIQAIVNGHPHSIYTHPMDQRPLISMAQDQWNECWKWGGRVDEYHSGALSELAAMAGWQTLANRAVIVVVVKYPDTMFQNWAKDNELHRVTQVHGKSVAAGG